MNSSPVTNASVREPVPPASSKVLPWLLLALGTAAVLAAVVARPAAARGAAGQDWPPFVLVAGLLLVGLVAHADGLFSAAAQALRRLAPGPAGRFVGATLAIGVVTALLNLDTSVAFLTPVLVGAATDQGEAARLLYGCILLSNAGSLLLPGSNLTNLIVIGHLHLAGSQFLARMWLPEVAALLVTAGVIAIGERRRPGRSAATGQETGGRDRVRPLAAAAVLGAVGVVVALRQPAPVVFGIGAVVVAFRLARRQLGMDAVREVLALPVLIGLFGVAIGVGALGRSWAGPLTLLRHLDPWSSAALAAGLSVVINNLPAASLLASREAPHPYALLVGLDIGPNLFATGSLAWFLWVRVARQSGARPSVRRACVLGAISAPLAGAAALALLTATGSA